MIILAVETSCDETAVAIMRNRELLASEVASQVAAHEKYGGIVPEIASRNHLVYAPRLIERATQRAKINMREVDAFAATSGPGLASSLMIGASIAKGLAIGFEKPYLAINHLEGHLLSPFFEVDATLPLRNGGAGDEDVASTLRPNVSLIVSGGHTMTIFVRGLADYEVNGRTVDDAAGEAFDKIAKMLRLGYPGGPEIEQRARGGNAKRFKLPRSMPDSENFSFSGLKTAVRYLLAKSVAPSEAKRSRGVPINGRLGNATGSLVVVRDDVLSDLCASVQQAIVDVLVQKTITAARKYNVGLVTMSGGVSCNQKLRRQLQEQCARAGLELKAAESWLCTDNAAMIAFAASLRLAAGFRSTITEEIDPNLALVR
jgi:N6-L-threonylcarbamoyladenine synthase